MAHCSTIPIPYASSVNGLAIQITLIRTCWSSKDLDTVSQCLTFPALAALALAYWTSP